MSQLKNNKYLKGLSESVNDRFSIDSINMTPTDWLCTNTTLKDKAFSVLRYPFQEQILNDMHQDLVCKKPSQVGLTEAQIRKALAFLARNPNTKLIYTLPNEDMYKRISIPRIKPIVEGDKVFNPPTDVKPTRSMGLMQIGSSYLYIVPVGESAATSIDADCVFIDETDLSDQVWLALMDSRMQNSDWKIKQSFSTPTYPAFGIDAQFEISDKHHYFRKCVVCNHHNNPEFNRKFVHIGGVPDTMEHYTDIEKVHLHQLDLKDSYVKCEKCHSPLDLSDFDNAQWVAEYNNSPHLSRGYGVTPFSTDRLSPEYITKSLIRFKNSEFKRGFYNTVLGQPYSDGDIQIGLDLVKEAFKDTVGKEPDIGSDVPFWLGIDVGQICHVVGATGSNKDDLQPVMFRAMNISELKPFVEDCMEKYNLVGGAIDREPYEPTAREIMELSRGKIVPVDYAKNDRIVFDGLGNVSHSIIGRTAWLDFVHTRLKRKSIKFNGYNSFKQILPVHLRDMVREEQPEKPTIWKKLTNNDHFFHSLAFLMVAPSLQELIRYKDKEDKRVAILFGGSTYGDDRSTSPLIGMTAKTKLDKHITTRVLNKS